MAAVVYPVRVDASLEAPLSRWLWLVKWLLAIPHLIVLAFLWVAFALLSVVAFVTILFTGSYPRPMFDFNVGVLRWSWRVFYYTYGALGTDQYPPFTLAEVPGYPAHLEIEYPGRLSRGLVLVKWWLLAIPHYIIVGLFAGGGTGLAWRVGNQNLNWGGGGLIGILVLVAALFLLFTGRYPQQIFDFVLGMNRWVLRVAAYVCLMTDEYPPFRLDMGGHEPGSTMTMPPPGPQHGDARPQEPSDSPPAPPPAPPAGGAPAGGPTAWTTGRIVSAVIGAVLVLVSLGLLGAGGAAMWANTTHSNGGYVDLGTTTYRTTSYALASDTIDLHASGNGWDLASALFGNVRIRATSTLGTAPIFIGIGPADAASRYLAGVEYTTVRSGSADQSRYLLHSGGGPAVPPAQAGFWVAQARGSGTQTLAWPVRSGSWTVVAMNADGSRAVSVRTTVEVTVPSLGWIAAGLLIGGVIFLAGGVILTTVPARRASR